MTRILFCSTGGDGHLLPLLPLAAAFAARGDEVTVATTAAHGDRLERLGLAHRPIGPSVGELQATLGAHLERIAQLPVAERRVVGFSGRFSAEARLRLPGLLDLAAAWRPDLIVYESADLAAPIVAAAAGVPVAHHSFGRAIPEAPLRAAAELVAPLWHGAGVEPDEFAGAYRGAYVDICPPSLRVPALSEPSSSHFLRPVAAATQESEARARPLVYATLGTRYNDPEVFRILLGALGTVDCDAIMTIGRDRSPDDLRPIPTNVTVAQYIPQDEILADCDAVVSHGGSGSFLAALAYGRPLVLLPQGADQLDNASACASLGVAEVVSPPEQSPDRVRRAVELVLHEPAYTVAAKAIAAEIAAMPSPAAVADELARQR